MAERRAWQKASSHEGLEVTSLAAPASTARPHPPFRAPWRQRPRALAPLEARPGQLVVPLANLGRPCLLPLGRRRLEALELAVLL